MLNVALQPIPSSSILKADLIDGICSELMCLPIIKYLTDLQQTRFEKISVKNVGMLTQVYGQFHMVPSIDSAKRADPLLTFAIDCYKMIGQCVQTIQDVTKDRENVYKIIAALSLLKTKIEAKRDCFWGEKVVTKEISEREGSRVAYSLESIEKIISSLKGSKKFSPGADEKEVAEYKNLFFDSVITRYLLESTRDHDNLTISEWSRGPTYTVNNKKWSYQALLRIVSALTQKNQWSAEDIRGYADQLMNTQIIPFFTTAGFSKKRAYYLSHAMTQNGIIGPVGSITGLVTLSAPVMARDVYFKAGNSHKIDVQGTNDCVTMSVELPIKLMGKKQKFIGSGMKDVLISTITLTVKIVLRWLDPNIDIPLIDNFGFDCKVEKITLPGTNIYLPDFVGKHLPSKEESHDFLGVNKVKYHERYLTIISFDSMKQICFDHFIKSLLIVKDNSNESNDKLIINFLRTWCNALLMRGLPGYTQFRPFDGDSIARLYHDLCIVHQGEFSGEVLNELEDRIMCLIESTVLINEDNIILGRGMTDVEDYKTYVTRQFSHMINHLRRHDREAMADRCSLDSFSGTSLSSGTST